MYRANTMAMTEMIPECMIQNIDQPQRKPANGPKVSRKKT